MTKSILITGSNSGFGRLIAKGFAEKGWRVAATMRDVSKAGDLTGFPNVHIVQLDVTDPASIQHAKEEILEKLNRIDIVVNNAGFGVYGAFELAKEEEIDRQFAVNVKGLMAVTQAWLPHFRENGGGMFINISSVSGINSYPLASLYVSTKWAVEGFTEALFYEVKPFNIKLKLVEPGGFRTNFQTSSIIWTTNPGITAYDEKMKANIDTRNDRWENMPDPVAVADMVYLAATDETDKLRYLVGDDARKMMEKRNELGAQKYIEQVYWDYIK